MATPQKPTDSHDEGELDLPPLDDDGELLGGHDDELSTGEESLSLDDSTSESEAERFGAFDGIGIDENGTLLDGAEGSDELEIDGEADLLAGAEVGLLDGSDEGDGRDAGSDDLVGDEESSEEDGGAEGTDEDPAAVLESEGAQERVGGGDASDDEGIDDDARFGGAPERVALEREPWPTRADAAWTCTRVDVPKSFAGIDPVTSAGDLVAAVEGDALSISTDSGATFKRVPGCRGVSAITIVSSKHPLRTVAAALHDPVRESTGIVLVRIDDAGHFAAELIADYVVEDDEPARVDRLVARAPAVGRFELLAVAGEAARILRPKA